MKKLQLTDIIAENIFVQALGKMLCEYEFCDCFWTILLLWGYIE